MIAGLKDRHGETIEVEIFPSFVESSKHFSAILFCSNIARRLQHANRYYELYENAIDGMFTLGANGRIRHGNKKVEDLTGNREGKLDEFEFQRFMPEEVAQGLVTFLKQRLGARPGSPTYQIESLSPNREKKYFDVTTVRSPISDSEIIVNIRDVTNVERLEKEIWESEEKYRSLVEQSRDIIFLMQREKIIFANQMAYEILGDPLPTTDIGWREVTQYLAKEDRSSVIEFFTLALKGKIKNPSMEIRLKGQSGATLHMALKTDIIAYRGEKALFGTLRDITESKKLEQKIKESEKLGTLAQFTASVAHEIRNPLQGLTSAVLLLSRGLDVQGENKDLLDVILNATNEINTTINHVVSMIKEPRYKFCEMDARTLVAKAIRIVTECKQYDPRIRVTTSFQRGLAPLYGDEAELRKSLTNLISNAGQALPGEGRIRIRLANAVQDSKPFVRITIRDTGIGIPASILPQVWEPFTTTKKKGMGIGLFITKRIVEDHGGTIRIVSTNKRGTTIQINLPAHRVKE